jgi:hypothetical protein
MQRERAHCKASDEMHNETKGTKTLNPILKIRRTKTLEFLRAFASARSQNFCGINRHQVLGLNMNLRIRRVLR